MGVVVGPAQEPPAAGLRVGRGRDAAGLPGAGPAGAGRPEGEVGVRDAREKAAAWLAKAKPTDTTQAAALRLLTRAPAREPVKALRRRSTGSSPGRTRTAAGASCRTRPATPTPPGSAVRAERGRGESRPGGGPRGVTFLVGTPEGRRVVADDARVAPGGTPAEEHGADHLLRQRLGDAGLMLAVDGEETPMTTRMQLGKRLRFGAWLPRTAWAAGAGVLAAFAATAAAAGVGSRLPADPGPDNVWGVFALVVVLAGRVCRAAGRGRGRRPGVPSVAAILVPRGRGRVVRRAAAGPRLAGGGRRGGGGERVDGRRPGRRSLLCGPRVGNPAGAVWRADPGPADRRLPPGRGGHGWPSSNGARPGRPPRAAVDKPPVGPTAEGRNSRLGVVLNCVKCDRGLPPDRPA